MVLTKKPSYEDFWISTTISMIALFIFKSPSGFLYDLIIVNLEQLIKCFLINHNNFRILGFLFNQSYFKDTGNVLCFYFRELLVQIEVHIQIMD